MASLPVPPAQQNVDLATLTGRAAGPEVAKGRFHLFLEGEYCTLVLDLTPSNLATVRDDVRDART